MTRYEGKEEDHCDYALNDSQCESSSLPRPLRRVVSACVSIALVLEQLTPNHACRQSHDRSSLEVPVV